MVDVPSLKLTLPDGVPDPPPDAVTVAVKVTNWPEADGLAEEVRAVVVPVLPPLPPLPQPATQTTSTNDIIQIPALE